MTALLVTLWVAGAAAIANAIRANRRTSLLLTMIWVSVAWIAVGWFLWSPTEESIYIVVSLFGAAGVSVLGARWPGAAAWQFVVVGLICVMLLPLVESQLLSRPLHWSGLRIVFVFGLLGTAFLNYAPTPLGPCVLLVGGGATTAMLPFPPDFAPVAIAAGPAIGWLCRAIRRKGRTDADRLWFAFSDRYGAIWSLRVMEQFNRSAANSGSATTLKWNGLNGPDGPESYERLCALLKRFGLPT